MSSEFVDAGRRLRESGRVLRARLTEDYVRRLKEVDGFPRMDRIRMGSEKRTRKDHLVMSITHLFLPKTTPHEADPFLEDVERFILHSVNDSISQAIRQSSFSELDDITKMLETWELLQPYGNKNSDDDMDLDTLRGTEDGPLKEIDKFVTNFTQATSASPMSTIPIYMRKQNSMLLLDPKENGSVGVQTFRAALPSKLVMTSLGSLSMSFPERNEVIQSTELLTSPAFARILYQLAMEKLDISTPLVTKRRQTENITAPDERDVAEPTLINDWLVAVLSPGSTLAANETQTQEKLKFTKKIRDQVNFRGGTRGQLPFRRSGMWASIKITLQLKLLGLFQNDVSKSKIVYKLLMLNFIADICNRLHSKKDELRIELDLAAQMLTKLGRRVGKFIKLSPASEGNVQILREQVLAHVESVVTTMQQFMLECQSEMSKVDNSDGLKKLQKSTPEDKLSYQDHHIPFLSSNDESTCTRTSTRRSGTRTTEELCQSMELKRYTSATEILRNVYDRYGESFKKRIWLHDTESFLKNKEKMESTKPDTILELVHTYVTQAMQHYPDKNNPLGISQMVLVVLKAVEFLDRKASGAHPVLKTFHSGINGDSFDCLLLPHSDDMGHLKESLDYFQERNAMATARESILPRKEITENSFPVCFASQDDGMVEMLDEILQKTEENIAKRLTDIQTARNECGAIGDKIEKLQREANMGRLTPQEFQRFLNQTEELDRTRNRTKTRFSLFERPLPTEDNLRRAVVFEALIPAELASLRDCLAILKFCLLEESTLPVEKNKTSTKWMEYSNLVQYLPGSSPSRKNAAITLGSHCLNVSRTVHTTLDITYCTDQMLIWDNGLDCIYSYSFIPPLRNLKTACSFQIKHTDNPTPYLHLQQYLEGFTHTQNEVIADQHACHGKMPLAEFITFGSLRAGHRIQLRNLHRAIESKELSLEEEPVLALILQTIWQLGPRDTGSGLREAHLDFEADGFSSATLDLLEKVVKTNETNSSNPIILMLAVLITTRIVDMNESMYDRCYKLLRSWRSVTKKWTMELEDKIQAETDSNHLKQLRTNLLLISICSALSYTISSSTKWDRVMKDEEDAVWWFHTISRLTQQQELRDRYSYYSRDSDSDDTTSLSEFTKVLLNFAKGTALRVNFEREDLNHPILLNSIRSFMTEKWSKGTPLNGMGQPQLVSGNLIRLNFAPAQVSTGEQSEEASMTFDIILGTFLVNGYREAQLPTAISRSSTFQRYFGKHSLHRIQKLSPTASKTVSKFHGKDYLFTHDDDEYSSRGDLVIKEVQEDGSTLTLIKHEQFGGVLAPSFVVGYTHWLNNSKDIVYLRKVPVQDSDYYLPPEYRLIRMNDSDLWRLRDEGNSSYHLLSTQSEGFKNVADELHFLELKQHINVAIDMKANIDILLPRYNLRFALKDAGLECLQYPGYYLKPIEKQDTLIGLENCTQLVKGSKRMLIIPNGKLHWGRNPSRYHHQVSINLDELLEPAYFVYTFDEVLHRLLANDSKQAWLYLAALYAATSSPQPEPFTGQTGTEMAVRILTSGFIWSSSPYDGNCLNILKFIKGLAPKRIYYGHQLLGRRGDDEEIKDGSMETTEWPGSSGFPSMCAYDGYAFIIDKLIEDSQRLQPLYYVGEAEKDSSPRKRKEREQTSQKLRLRSYFRHLCSYNESVAVQPEYFTSSLMEEIDRAGGGNTIVASTRKDETQLGGVAQIVSTRLASSCSPQLQIIPGTFPKDNLLQFIFADYKPPLAGSKISAKDMFGLEFKTSWFSIYKLAAKNGKNDEEKSHLTLLLAAMAHRKAPIVQLLNLHYISAFADEHQVQFPISPGEFPQQFEGCQQPLFDPSENDVTNAIESIIKAEMSSYIGVLARRKGKSHHELIVQIRAAAQAIREKYWPCTNIPETDVELEEIESLLPSNYCISQRGILSQINILLQQWDLTGKLRRFAEALQRKLNVIYDTLDVNIGDTPSEYPHFSDEKTCATINIDKLGWTREVQLETILDISVLDKDLWKEAQIYFSTGRDPKLGSATNRSSNEHGQDPISLNSERLRYQEKVNEIMQNLQKMLNVSYFGRILGLTGICPRVNHASLLNLLVHHIQPPDINQSNMDGNILQVYIGALAVLWTHIKRLDRCLTYHQNCQAPELQRELGNIGHENWSPEAHPEWLLLELELNIMIRPIQMDVAKQMLKMPKEPNGVMQLNMGEGKTSVIVPMLCVALGHSNSFCRVTVLGAMFNMNYRILSFAIGGLLNRRLYAFPCKRNMNIDGASADSIQLAYKECLKMKGVVITQPDYRLSFRLLAYDSILKKDVEVGLKLMETENWLRKYSRDVLDESDELLNVKYQLVYTVGGKIPLDGEERRWTTCQRLLQIVQQVGRELLEKHGEEALEMDKEEQLSNPHQFTPIRLLNSKIFPEFISSIAGHVLDDEITRNGEEKLLLKMFLTQEEIPKSDLVRALNTIKGVPEKLNKILVVSGYLRRGVLTLGLSKRWRVQYGVDMNREKGKMAIPFRAKDVPAERAEFGHPELAILLTHLSYYYSGLSDDQLEEALNSLKKKQGAEATYESWIQEIPSDQVPGYVTTLRGLNLKNSSQKAKLFELLRRHKLVIDFWLINEVYKSEAQQFPSKLVMTSWDLCYERGEHPITGFSGTNDSSVLLPLNIAQQNLESLLDTDAKVESALLQPKNQGHMKLEMGTTCLHILEKMKRDNLTVLIDAGALMLEWDNEQIATKWLEVDEEIEAVLYFNYANALMVMCRGIHGQNHDVPFELSSYHGSLEKCGVFLDDQHTRGTDLKFPMGSRACVTVGGDMKRDKLLQACMRMRKLGDGHWVTLYLSHEAYDKSKRVGGSDEESTAITTKSVLDWVCKNTENFNKDGLLYWAIAGKNYAQRLAAEDNFHFPNPCTNFRLDGIGPSLEAKGGVLANQCLDDELNKLMDLYGQHSQLDKLVNVIPKWFSGTYRKLVIRNNNLSLPVKVEENFERISSEVVERCRQHIPDKMHLSGVSMEEEQERELELETEIEVEEERIPERPMKVAAATNALHENVKKVVFQGAAIEIKAGITRLCDMFKETTFWEKVQPDGWGNEVFATEDFITVISSRFVKTDLFLRRIEWIVSRKEGPGSESSPLLILSPFEVNELMPFFRRDEVACYLHMFALRRSAKQDLLLQQPKLALPETYMHFHIPDGSRSLAAMLLASGNLYFGGMEEQKGFASFLSLVRKPWSKDEEDAVENHLISITGFMSQQYRNERLADGQMPYGFDEDPTELVRLILRCKHPLLSDMARVVRLLDGKRYVTLG